ncbi:pentapeptide repeat-containing protein [Bacillus sp. JJ1764]|uniref:pentapeptide repeat-containing protein n=1 Tax=Bacillus sp. JJ1764 TaxID=3122964 RepID=UPI002FFE3210
MKRQLTPDCEKCFGLCCVALPFAKSADFAFNKDGGTPCKNLQSNFLCGIHSQLRDKGFKGCTVFECFGAGQQVSQVTYKGADWRENPESASDMFEVFPIMQQLHEMLLYLNEALSMKETQPIHKELKSLIEKTEHLTNQDPQFLLTLDVPAHRAKVNPLLLKTSELVRGKIKPSRTISKDNLIGAKLKGADLQGSNLRGALLIAADLQKADLRMSDFIGADIRDADLSGANLQGSFFLTQAQINSAKGDRRTKLPNSLKTPQHWLVN